MNATATLMETIEHSLTFEEYLTYISGTDIHYELIDGRMIPVSPPLFRHLLIAKFLEQILTAEIERQQQPYLCLREVGVRTSLRKSRIVDICILPKSEVAKLIEEVAVVQIPPLLVVEVVSPHSIVQDYRYKRTEYAALEVPEYWIVDPLESKVSILLLEEGFYEVTVFHSQQVIVSPTFPHLTLSVQEILSENLL